MLVSTDHGIIDSETGLPPVDNVEAPAYPAEAQATFDAKVEERIAEALNADEAPLAPPPPPPPPPV
jgi:hypothetical protein